MLQKHAVSFSVTGFLGSLLLSASALAVPICTQSGGTTVCQDNGVTTICSGNGDTAICTNSKGQTNVVQSRNGTTTVNGDSGSAICQDTDNGRVCNANGKVTITPNQPGFPPMGGGNRPGNGGPGYGGGNDWGNRPGHGGPGYGGGNDWGNRPGHGGPGYGGGNDWGYDPGNQWDDGDGWDRNPPQPGYPGPVVDMPRTPEFCMGGYVGHFSGGERIGVRINGRGQIIVRARGTEYMAVGSCQMMRRGRATVNFLLNGDRRYSFTGGIFIGRNGMKTMTLSQVRNGREIDRATLKQVR